MLQCQVTIASDDGLHARPANDFAKLAATLPGKVTVFRPEGERVRGDSMLSLMTLGLRAGESVVIEIGEDGHETLLDSLVSVLTSH